MPSCIHDLYKSFSCFQESSREFCYFLGGTETLTSTLGGGGMAPKTNNLYMVGSVNVLVGCQKQNDGGGVVVRVINKDTSYFH